ncbi:PE domain-containing protein [Nocardia sp. NPDC052001]|uniref:PE domain-containing protein n=1 Tax=Nocardia sp. NPDC052001 TaxID=3154853 RepID=UPI0034149065
MFVDVAPEELPGIGGQLQTIHASLSSVVGSQLHQAVPIPAGADSVSALVSARFIAQTAQHFAVTVPGLAHLLAGAEMIYPVSGAYGGQDGLGGVGIGAAGARFQA